MTKVFAQQPYIKGHREKIETDYFRTHVFNPRQNFHLLQLIQYELDKEEKAEIKRRIELARKTEKENEIYRKYLVNRIKYSSILRDFHTMRY